ncbi:putative DNA polymerase alpha/epsilon subunit B [Encephalitozoon intestinalis ATCC 50506]|uniref:DNA polymerase alpha/epsilon subunit B n=1 Tax=Encephalitozoon intestinalis (strain ATCC 50506) TaxID=876142 RepID=E0S752_ENCIT|nr:putative DNA polymerase alpha/epsilon subunit B [Encephalitozoon intestinalis ATCC 50506]ADM11480.1 putative DNA polymerase alpha/epsilon subunit B [Encephalitozoon intestinalis ATCC 50506]UTX45192.1 DNA polymerase II subunit A [Encephalitozoon intestinalis]
MRESIYKEFTCKKGIMLSSETLEYLEHNIKNDSMLENISIEYKRRSGPKLADLGLIREIIESLDTRKDVYNVLSQNFKEKNDLLKYRHLLQKIERVVTPIYLLDEDHATIFGCYYKDRNGREVLEDDGDIIPIDTSECHEDVFLCDNIFVAMEGRKTGDRFVMSRVHLPSIEKTSKKAKEERRDLKVLFFSDFHMNEANGTTLRKILNKIPTGVVVLMGKLCSGKSSGISYTSFMNGLRPNNALGSIPDIILCPDADDVYPSFLPKEIEVPEEYSKIIKAASNPFKLETDNFSIGVIRDDLFRYKEKGTFIGKNYVDSFARVVLSQYSFNPFGISNLDIDTIPDVFVVGQDLYPFVVPVEGTLFISCPSFRDEMSFVSYDLSQNDAWIINSKNVLG